MNPIEPQADLNRRSFLKGGSLASLMMMLGGVEITAQDAATKPAAAVKPAKKIGPPVKCGVIGVGAWGRDMIGHLSRLPNAPVTGVAETYGASLRRAKSGAPNAAQFEDYRKLLESKDVEAVVIATPTHQHKEIAIAALQAGKHVYCEAPLAHTIEDARAIAKAARESKQIFQVGLQYRANPQHHHVVDFVRTGAAGALTVARSQYHKKESWRRTSPSPEREKELNWRLRQDTSPGLVGEIGIHSIDVASWFMRANPVSVTGFGSILHWKDGRNVADTSQVVLEYPGGARMIYDATLTNSFEGNYDVFSGTDAAIMIRENRAWMFKEADSPLLGWEVYAKKDTFPATGEAGIALVANATQLIAQGLKPAEAAADGDSPAYYSLEAFIESINEKKAPHAGWKEGFEATVAALKANEAVNTNSKITFEPKWFEV
ncbi:MAG: putative dehydrogenase [Verrucomicrobia bacterium]|jgi:predicted dehydrogenase|nr:putative dehydrogenase [Verrucomicrobiota bacterium]